jgi:hypothetical protein
MFLEITPDLKDVSFEPEFDWVDAKDMLYGYARSPRS